MVDSAVGSRVARPLVLSAVVTCYKDEPALLPMHQRLTDVLSSLGVSYEIIFVNDCSPDDSQLVLERLAAADSHVLVIEHSRNFGSQSAFLSGMEVAGGDAVILLDGDLQDPPELISAFYAKWREGYDVVYGRRGKREGSRLMTLLYQAFYRVFRKLSDVPMPLDAGDFSLLDRRVVGELLLLPETDQFLRGLRAWVGFKQVGIDYLRPERPFGRSTHGFLKNFWWARKGIFSFSSRPIEVLTYVGAIMTTLWLLALVYIGIDTWRRPEVPQSTSAVVVMIGFFGSLNLLAIAVLGEYLIKVFEEAKRRPKFIRRSIRHQGAYLTSRREIAEFIEQRGREDRAKRELNAPGEGDGSSE